jgi:hypothetical protein
MWISHFRLSVFSSYVMSYSVHLLFFSLFSVSYHITVPIKWDSHFPSLSVFSPYYRTYSVCFSFSMFFSVSSHIPGPTVCVSFSRFSHFSSHIPGPSVYIYLFSRFSVFLTIFHVLPCEILIFLVCPFFRHITGPTVWVSPFFTFPSFSSHIPGPIMFFSHFPRLSVFSTCSRYYSACVSFHTFFRFLALFQVLMSTFLIFHVFDSFSKNFRSYNVSHFPRFSVFLAIFQFLPCEFLIFVYQ